MTANAYSHGYIVLISDGKKMKHSCLFYICIFTIDSYLCEMSIEWYDSKMEPLDVSTEVKMHVMYRLYLPLNWA